MQLYDSTPTGNGLFNLWGKLFGLGLTLDTVRGGQIEQHLAGLKGVLDLAPEIKPVWEGGDSWRAGGGAWQQTIRSAALAILYRYMLDGQHMQRWTSERDALAVLVGQVRAGGFFFNGSTRSVQVQAAAGNQGDVAIHIGTRGPRGYEAMLLGETIQAVLEADTLVLSGRKASTPWERLWPTGSGLSASIPLMGVQQSILRNADFEKVDDWPRADDWILFEGSHLDVHITDTPEQQRITISGTPTGGYWVLRWTDPAGRAWQTDRLSPTVSSAVLQRALRAIPGLERVQVEGANPWVVTFYGVPVGDVAQMTSINQLKGSNITIGITTLQQGNPRSYRGYSVILATFVTATPGLAQDVTLTPRQAYGFAMRLQRTATASGTLRVQLQAGIGGPVLTDEAGQMNRLDIPITSLPTSGHASVGAFFSVKPQERQPVTLTIQTTGGIGVNQSLSIDEVILAPAQKLYEGGPYIFPVAGWRPAEGDRWTVTVSDNWAQTAKWQYVLDRWLDLRALTDMAMPTSGTTRIPDTLLD